MTTYQQVPLGDVCQLTAGPSGALLGSLHEGPEGVPVITPPDITDQHAIDTKRLRRVPSSRAERLSRFVLREGDVLYVRQGALGRLALTGPEHATWVYGSACIRLRPRQDLLLSAYLVAYLSHEPIREALLGQANPGTVPSLNTALLQDFPIIMLPLARQHALADAMADIEANIGVHLAIVNRLGALRQAVFGEALGERGPACRN